jgi:L-rhamnose-H+ transport protein
VNPNPFLGVIFHWIGGFCSATNFIPFRGIKRWSWEVYWILQGVAAWMIAPTLIALIFVPHPFAILKAAYVASPGNIYWPIFWGLLWGVGGLTFGLAIRYLGLGLGYAIALGFCTVFGTIVPPLWDGQMHAILHSTSGEITLGGLGLTLIAIAVSGAAGASKEQEITPEEKAETGERDYSFAKGLVIAIFAGIMSSFFAIGLSAGKPIGDMTRDVLIHTGHATLWANLPILIVVLWGGFVTNFIWSVILLAKNHSFAQFGGAPGDNPMGTKPTTGETLVDFDPRDYIGRINGQVLAMNYLFAASAGVIWYFQFFFYSMGQTKMGRYDFASWTLHMASIIIFANLWGLALKEWKGTSRRTRGLVFSGLVLLIGSTVVVGYGSYLAAQLK